VKLAEAVIAALVIVISGAFFGWVTGRWFLSDEGLSAHSEEAKWER